MKKNHPSLSCVRVSALPDNSFYPPIRTYLYGGLSRIAALLAVITLVFILGACPGGGENTPLSDSKEISGFSFTDPPATGVISGTDISVSVPSGTNVASLVPTITHTGVDISPASGTARNFSSPVRYTVTAEDGSTVEYTVTVTVAPANSKEITGFSFASPAATGVIDGTNISVSVPFGTDLVALVPTITHTGKSISPESGTEQDFSSPVTYTVSAQDGSTAQYTVTVTVASANSTEITGFSFASPAATGVIDGTNISVNVPFGTDLAALVPTITHTGKSISPASGTARNFTNPVTYTVTAEDGSTKDYTVTVTVEGSPLSDSKEISGFSFASLKATGVINGTAVSVSVPSGTNVAQLVPTITHTGKSISPASGTARNFTNPVTYTVTAEDGSTKEYTVTVTVEESPLSNSKAITGFSFAAPPAEGVISGTNITVTVPYGTDVTDLVPEITHTGESISPESETAQDFTDPVTYTVTAEDETTAQYIVTVTVALNPAKEITGFSFADLPATVRINGTAISVTVPYGTSLVALVPAITHTGASVNPASGTKQDFTNPVTYHCQQVKQMENKKVRRFHRLSGFYGKIRS